ncbi:hypothetical protein A1O7_02023 [Cladophialophora yegresii CBS 114405]|uniref:Structure-specific endonuclease subunit SLX4 n=1 Tax=Cladophialophora yegresii CBS 114405 TaxID=1182544 RepID=W9W9C5_9EURO|nr:uncharacterized protein A1O7_02023 [Cladophialophora yegresii CBS 114405]EXJ61595.1 hypothetical protein A1O7_02023 [Cladophialophora yegresii CBS 114405]
MPSAAVVIISSSPPPAFAPSPTPAESPSPSKSPSTPVRDGAKRFKKSSQTRHGFSPGFSSAHALLARPGAENIPLQSPCRSKFRLQASEQARDGFGNRTTTAQYVRKRTDSQTEQLSNHFKPSKSCASLAATSAEVAQEEDQLGYKDGCGALISAGNNKGSVIGRHSSPRPMEKAVPRRLDWTPVKSDEYTWETPESEQQENRLSNTLLDAYAYSASATSGPQVATKKVNGNGDQSKRKRIDLVMTTSTTPSSSVSQLRTGKEAKAGSRGKGRAPSKKALTITALATSAYCDGQSKEGKLQPMMEYLASTQAAIGNDCESGIDVSLKKFSKPKASSKKAGSSKKPPVKSRLVSPTSAMKMTLEQPFLFGPASQLARDESPTLMRDTMAALQQSEEILSDPFSPQRTQPFSIESTSPRVVRGTNRLVRRRNLWSAAGRDADNALLQVETVDMTDSPAVRQALAGKDALMQPDGPHHHHIGHADDGNTRSSVVRTPCTRSVGPVIDIYEIETPGLRGPVVHSTNPPVRGMHTLRTVKGQHDDSCAEAQPGGAHPKPVDASPRPKAVMPSYDGWSDPELKKQVAAYGFKSIRKREKMIELLERCWKSKHGVVQDSDGPDNPADTLSHGDFLSKVHDVSVRPTPKVKKPRAKRKSDSGDPTAPKEPKKRKKAASKTEEGSKKEQAPRQRKKKTKVLSDEKIIDVDDIGETNTKQAAEKHEDLAAASNQPEEIRVKVGQVMTSVPTPPPTLPKPEITISTHGVEDAQPSAHSASNMDGAEVPPAVLTPKQTQPTDVMVQIHAAIHHHPATGSRSSGSRNHQTSPTWREKILMYDPIVLEELTVWLNTEGFKAIGEDGEVSLVEVRNWCEQNGVCCLGGWRGRGKHGEGE